MLSPIVELKNDPGLRGIKKSRILKILLTKSDILHRWFSPFRPNQKSLNQMGEKQTRDICERVGKLEETQPCISVVFFETTG